jgi:hypothetical protein
MTWQHTRKSEIEKFQIGKMLAVISGMAIFSLGASVALWRAGIYIPNLRFSAVLFGTPCLGLYVAMVVNLLRLRSKLQSHVDSSKPQ